MGVLLSLKLFDRRGCITNEELEGLGLIVGGNFVSVQSHDTSHSAALFGKDTPIFI
jgi:hypothetical protein